MSEKINTSSQQQKEIIHLTIQKHAFYFFPEIFACIIGTLFIYILFLFFPKIIGYISESFFWIIFGSILILSLVFLGISFLKKMTKIHIITESRIINPIQKEYFNFEDIDEIQSKVEGFWGNLFGFGTISIQLKNSKQYHIFFIPKVIETTRKIHSIISRKKAKK